MFLALKELRYYKTKYGLIIGLLILLTFMVLFLRGLANGLSDATSSMIRKSEASFYAISDDSDGIITRSEISQEQYDTIKSEVDEATAFNLQRMAIYKADNNTKIDCTYLAVDTNSFMMVDITEGTTPGLNEIILNDIFADENIAIGDIIYDVATGTPLKVVGFTHGESYVHSNIGVMNLETFGAIRNNITHSDKTMFNAVGIKGSNVNLELKDVTLASKAEIIDKIPSHAQEQLTIQMILYVLLFVSAVILGIFFYILTIQKIPQFGTLKAIGTSMKKLASMVVWQVLLIAGFSIIVGDLLTFGMAAMMPNKMPFFLQVPEALIISAGFIIISVVCSLFSLIKVAKVDPIIAIGGNE